MRPDIAVIHAINPELIIFKVAEEFEITTSDMRRRSRKRKYMYPRQVAMHLLRKHTQLSLEEIGLLFRLHDDSKPFDHTTVLHACRNIENLCESDKEFAQTVHVLDIDCLEL